MKMFKKLSGIIVVSLALYGCSGSGSGSSVNTNLLPVGKNTLVFSITSTSKFQTSVNGIDFSITLLPGMSVATANGLSGPIVTDSVLPVSGMEGSSLSFGSYSVSTRKVYLGMVTTSDTFRSGKFLRLICNVAPNTNITLSDLLALNSPMAVKKAVGFDSITNTTVVLTGSLKLLMDLAL